METPKIFESEYRFCLILWDVEPITSRKLSELCKEQLGWSKTTTYTVIKRLQERGVLKNEHTIVTSLISKKQAEEAQINELVEKKFNNSIPSFIAAFARKQKLSDEEIKQINDIINKGK